MDYESRLLFGGGPWGEVAWTTFLLYMPRLLRQMGGARLLASSWVLGHPLRDEQIAAIAAQHTSELSFPHMWKDWIVWLQRLNTPPREEPSVRVVSQPED